MNKYLVVIGDRFGNCRITVMAPDEKTAICYASTAHATMIFFGRKIPSDLDMTTGDTPANVKNMGLFVGAVNKFE